MTHTHSWHSIPFYQEREQPKTAKRFTCHPAPKRSNIIDVFMFYVRERFEGLPLPSGLSKFIVSQVNNIYQPINPNEYE